MLRGLSRISVLLDVAAAVEVVSTAAERVVAGVVGEGVRVADDARRGGTDCVHDLLRVHTLVEVVVAHLQLLVLVLHVHRAGHVALGLDRLGQLGRVERIGVVHAVDGALDVAAALVLVGEHVRLANRETGDITLQLAVLVAEDRVHIMEHLVRCRDGLRGAAGDGGHEVAVLVLQVVEVEAVLHEVLGSVLGLVTAVASPAEPAAVHEGEQDYKPPCAISAPAIVVVSHDGAHIRRGHATAENVLTHDETFFLLDFTTGCRISERPRTIGP